MEERGNLVFTREKGESIIVDLRPFGLGLVEIRNGGKRRNGNQFQIRADKRIRVDRSEVFQKREDV